MKKILIISVLLFLFAMLYSQKKSAYGIVFDDVNGNKRFDKTDNPLKDVYVSTLDTIVCTDKTGAFRLLLNNRDIIFVVKPMGYVFSLKENHVPDFYYLYEPAGSPMFLESKGLEPTGVLPDTVFFMLHKSKEKEIYKAQMIGDIQVPTFRQVLDFRESVVSDLLKYPADFSVCLGDIVDNNPEMYPAIEQSLVPFDNPIYMVFGNHDITYKSPGYEFESETFRSYFGPDYYSFNYGKTHFIVLNTVFYSGWKDTTNGDYTGNLYPSEFKWVRQDLQLATKADQIVIMAHIPLLPNTFEEAPMKNIFEMLEQTGKPIFGIFGHMHENIAWNYNEQLGWKGKQSFKGLVAGAACGAWWSGPFSTDSIPEAMCTDGSPRGFFIMDFKANEIDRQFIPIDKPSDYQLRISSPEAIIPIDSIPNSYIYVNIFDSDRNCSVTYTIDKSIKGELKNTVEFDPYVVRNAFRFYNQDNYYPGPSPCPHLWKAPLPDYLSLGVHLIEINVKSADGKTLNTKKIFEIVK